MLTIPHHAPHTLNTKTLSYITCHTPSFITCQCSQVLVLFQIPHRCSQPLWFHWSGIGFSSRVLFIRPEGSVKNHFDNFAIVWQMKQHIPVARSKPIISMSIAAPKCKQQLCPRRNKPMQELISRNFHTYCTFESSLSPYLSISRIVFF